MSAFDYDLFVIGGGSGGVRAARVAAKGGARVGITEEFRYGGTCVIRGCVPKKLMVYASSFPDMVELARGYGWTGAELGTHDWPGFTARRHEEIGRLSGVYRSNLQSAGVSVFDQRGTLVDPHTVQLADGTTATARHILLAVGGTPFVPNLPGAELAITSDDIFNLERKPGRAVIVGGGYIGAEFSTILNGLGVETTLVYRGEMFLRGFDREVARHTSEQMAAKGVTFRFETDLDRIEGTPEGPKTVVLDNGDRIETDLVLMATGRAPATTGLGLEAAGVRTGAKGTIEVDRWSQTSVPSIYAVGDCTGRLELTPVAIREGQAFAETVFMSQPTTFEHCLVPTAIFTQPEIGTIGMSEEQARREGYRIEVYTTDFRAMVHAFAQVDERMLMKLIVDHQTDRVLGCHIVGHAAGELIQMLGIAVKMGATKADFDRTCAVHPTAAEEIVTMREPVRRPGVPESHYHD